jgi:hypothetical protein
VESGVILRENKETRQSFQTPDPLSKFIISQNTQLLTDIAISALGVQKPTGENLKVVCSEFSTLS